MSLVFINRSYRVIGSPPGRHEDRDRWEAREEPRRDRERDRERYRDEPVERPRRDDRYRDDRRDDRYACRRAIGWLQTFSTWIRVFWGALREFERSLGAGRCAPA